MSKNKLQKIEVMLSIFNPERIKFGAGYRVYFGQEEDTIIILLSGGDKSSQDKDIKKAKKYWKDYQRQGND